MVAYSCRILLVKFWPIEKMSVKLDNALESDGITMAEMGWMEASTRHGNMYFMVVIGCDVCGRMLC